MLSIALHVNDLFYVADTVAKELELSQSAAEILKEANMNLRKFLMNSGELRNVWFERDLVEEKVNVLI
ncbi:hypothetical protein NPIL_168791, partial [Nephila pilipes]